MAKRKQRVVLSIVGVGVLAIVIALGDRLPEQYYRWQLSRSYGEDAWTIAATLADMDSAYARDWYLERLANDSFEDRKRSMEALIETGDLTVLPHLLLLRAQVSPAPATHGELKVTTIVAPALLPTIPDLYEAYDVLQILHSRSGITAALEYRGKSGLVAKASPEGLVRARDEIRMLTLVLGVIRSAPKEFHAELKRLADDSPTSELRLVANVLFRALQRPPKTSQVRKRK